MGALEAESNLEAGLGPLDDPLFIRVQNQSARLAERYANGWSTVDIGFLSFLLETSRFGFFAFGPVTIDVGLVEDLIIKTAGSLAPPASGLTSYSEDFVEFTGLLMKELRRSGRRHVDELHYLLAFMRIGKGVPGRVFAELGVGPEQVEAYASARGSDGNGDEDGVAEERLYSPEEAADYLSVHVKTVRSWIRSGRLRASRLAGQRALRIRASDLRDVLEPVEPEGD